MDLRELTRTVQQQGAELRELRAMLGNRPSRRPPPPPPMRLTVDHNHEDDVTGTPVHETGIKQPGYLEDVWKILSSPRAQSPTDSSPNKVASSIAQRSGHDEGWVWGEVAVDFFSFGNDAEYGWAVWTDIIGLEEEGFTNLNLMTHARWNWVDPSGNSWDNKVGPIWFDGFEENWAHSEGGTWLLGKMIYASGYWYPAFKGPALVYAKTLATSTPQDLPVLHDDHCPVFRNPRAYRILENFKVWTLGAAGGKVNVHQVAACNRDHISSLWDHLAVLDWSTADIMGWHDNAFDVMFGGAGTTSGTLTNYLETIYLLLVCLQALHAPACNSQMTAATTARGLFNSNTPIPYVPKCPLPTAGHNGDYHHDAMLSCSQIGGG